MGTSTATPLSAARNCVKALKYGRDCASGPPWMSMTAGKGGLPSGVASQPCAVAPSVEGMSIERHGLIQPITVKRQEGREGYVLVAGERRYRAHELLGRDDILAVVTSGDPEEIALIENVQREDLHPLEEAAAYARMMARHQTSYALLLDSVSPSTREAYRKLTGV